MADLEVHVDLNGRTRPVGIVRNNWVRGAQTMIFEYAAEWLADSDRFALQPALALTRGAFVPRAGQASFGAIGDSARYAFGGWATKSSRRRYAPACPL